jgi:hypothetical protein
MDDFHSKIVLFRQECSRCSHCNVNWVGNKCKQRFCQAKGLENAKSRNVMNKFGTQLPNQMFWFSFQHCFACKPRQSRWNVTNIEKTLIQVSYQSEKTWMWHRSNGSNGIAKQWATSDPDSKFWMMWVSKQMWWDRIRFNFRLFSEQITLESGNMRFESIKSVGTGNKLCDEFSPREGWRGIWAKEIGSRFTVRLSFDLTLWKFI